MTKVVMRLKTQMKLNLIWICKLIVGATMHYAVWRILIISCIVHNVNSTFYFVKELGLS